MRPVRPPAISLLVMATFFLAAPLPTAAQSPWRSFEVELRGAAGRYRDGASDNSRRYSTAALGVRATLLRYAFVEMERTMAAWQYDHCVYVALHGPMPVGGDGCEPVHTRVFRFTLGGGVQLPVGPFRPYAGASWGETSWPESPDYHRAAAARTRFVGLELALTDRVRISAERRERRERGPAVWPGHWNVNPEWTLGLAIAFH